MDLDKTLYDEIGARAYSALEQEQILPRTAIMKRGIEGVSRLVGTYILVGDSWFWVEEVEQQKLPDLWVCAKQEDPAPPKEEENTLWMIPLSIIDDVMEDWEEMAV